MDLPWTQITWPQEHFAELLIQSLKTSSSHPKEYSPRDSPKLLRQTRLLSALCSGAYVGYMEDCRITSAASLIISSAISALDISRQTAHRWLANTPFCTSGTPRSSISLVTAWAGSSQDRHAICLSVIDATSEGSLSSRSLPDPSLSAPSPSRICQFMGYLSRYILLSNMFLIQVTNALMTWWSKWIFSGSWTDHGQYPDRPRSWRWIDCG